MFIFDLDYINKVQDLRSRGYNVIEFVPFEIVEDQDTELTPLVFDGDRRNPNPVEDLLEQIINIKLV